MSTGQGEQRQPLSAERFRDVIGRLASGVTVVTTVADGLRYGTTASAVTSLSLEPPMLLVCLNKSSSTGQAIAAARHFAVNVLDQQHPDLAVRFAGKGDDKFAGVVTVEGSRGAPLLEGALATLECRVADEVTGGTHTIFIGEVDGTSARHGAPLAYFRGQFGRLEMAQDENALASLRAKVLRRDVVVGSALSVDGLAGELDMPRESVYYALEKLTGEGLVTRDQTGELCAEHGIRATFMAKLYAGHSGSGGHLHQSLRRGGVNVFGDGSGGLSEHGSAYVGGLLATMGDLTAMLNPFVNSYKRVDPDLFVATRATWGLDTRSAACRAILNVGEAGARVEHRRPGADASPYLVTAAVLAGGLHGLRHGIDPGPPLLPGDDLAASGAPVPSNLREAVERFEASPLAVELLGQEFVTTFALTRRGELAAYEKWLSDSITDWELARYPDHL